MMRRIIVPDLPEDLDDHLNVSSAVEYAAAFSQRDAHDLARMAWHYEIKSYWMGQETADKDRHPQVQYIIDREAKKAANIYAVADLIRRGFFR